MRRSAAVEDAADDPWRLVGWFTVDLEPANQPRRATPSAQPRGSEGCSRPDRRNCFPRAGQQEAVQEEQAQTALASGGAAGADQGAVWGAIDELRAEHEASSPTAALHDVYESPRGRLREI